MRRDGHDPAHSGAATEKRAAKVRDENRKSAEWNRRSEVRPEPDVFRREILPFLRSVELKEMASATGLSIDYCSKIRRGFKVPHPRHWAALRGLDADEQLQSGS